MALPLSAAVVIAVSVTLVFSVAAVGIFVLLLRKRQEARGALDYQHVNGQTGSVIALGQVEISSPTKSGSRNQNTILSDRNTLLRTPCDYKAAHRMNNYDSIKSLEKQIQPRDSPIGPSLSIVDSSDLEVIEPVSVYKPTGLLEYKPLTPISELATPDSEVRYTVLEAPVTPDRAYTSYSRPLPAPRRERRQDLPESIALAGAQIHSNMPRPVPKNTNLARSISLHTQSSGPPPKEKLPPPPKLPPGVLPAWRLRNLDASSSNKDVSGPHLINSMDKTGYRDTDVQGDRRQGMKELWQVQGLSGPLTDFSKRPSSAHGLDKARLPSRNEPGVSSRPWQDVMEGQADGCWQQTLTSNPSACHGRSVLQELSGNANRRSFLSVVSSRSSRTATHSHNECAQESGSVTAASPSDAWKRFSTPQSAEDSSRPSSTAQSSVLEDELFGEGAPFEPLANATEMTLSATRPQSFGEYKADIELDKSTARLSNDSDVFASDTSYLPSLSLFRNVMTGFPLERPHSVGDTRLQTALYAPLDTRTTPLSSSQPNSLPEAEAASNSQL